MLGKEERNWERLTPNILLPTECPHASYFTALTTHVVDAFVWWKMNSSHKNNIGKKGSEMTKKRKYFSQLKAPYIFHLLPKIWS